MRTDEQGTITITSDGQTIKVNKKVSAIKPQAPPKGIGPPAERLLPESKQNSHQ